MYVQLSFKVKLFFINLFYLFNLLILKNRKVSSFIEQYYIFHKIINNKRDKSARRSTWIDMVFIEMGHYC
jgi:hypothetical protein